MQMWHTFACIGTAVDDDAKTGLQLKFLCQLARCQQQFAEELSIPRRSVRQPWNDSLGHDQNVDRRLRIDVTKRKDIVIFENDFGGNLSGDDFFENRHG